MMALERQLWRTALAWRFRLFQRHRYRRLVLEHADGLDLVVLPQVFNPKLLRTGELFVNFLSRSDLVQSNARVLDLGTGSGAAALAAARKGCSVTAVDINPYAVRCSRINALLNNLENAVDVRQGDLFEPVDDQRFDLILFNPPYYRGTPRDALDHAWRAPDLIERFAAQLGAHLSPRGSALLILSTDGEQDAFLAQLAAHNFATRPLLTKDFRNERISVIHATQPC